MLTGSSEGVIFFVSQEYRRHRTQNSASQDPQRKSHIILCVSCIEKTRSCCRKQRNNLLNRIKTEGEVSYICSSSDSPQSRFTQAFSLPTAEDTKEPNPELCTKIQYPQLSAPAGMVHTAPVSQGPPCVRVWMWKMPWSC